MRAKAKTARTKRAEQREHTRMLAEQPTLLEDDDPALPPLPPVDEHGHYPAIATARVIVARQLLRGRQSLGWTQAELAAKAGVRQETISRIETGKHTPGLKTMAKIERALQGHQRNGNAIAGGDPVTRKGGS